MAQIHRRSFLERLALGAGAGLLSPVVRTLHAQAQGTLSARKRLIVFMQGNGFHFGTFVPPEFGGKAVYGKDLVQSTDYTLPPKFAPLAPYRNRMLLVDGLVNQQGRAGHFANHVFMSCVPNLSTGDFAGGQSGGQTFDQLVADTLSKGAPFRSVHLGARTGTPDGKASTGSLMTGSYAKTRGDSIPIQLVPTEAYTQLLANVGAGAADPARSAADRKAELGARQRLLDFIADDVRRLRGQLAGAERAKLDEYLGAVDDAGKRLTAFANAPAAGACGAPKVLSDPPSPEERFSAMVDIGTAALACGLTDVLTLNFSGLGYAFKSLGLTESLHSVGHGYGGDEWHVKITTWFSGEMARMLGKLSAIREGDRTIFDQSVLLFTADNGEAHHARDWRWPVLLVGNAGGGLKADGRYIRYPARQPDNNAAATPVNVTDAQRPVGDLFSALGHALGVPVDDFGKNGLEKVKGPLSELLA